MSRPIIKIKVNTAICAAAVILFIPIHTLNIPKVRVCKEKYSTVPKSDITSILTRAKPTIMAGLANGRLRYQNVLLPYIFDTSRRLEGVCRNAVLLRIYT
tara:strand:+ start:230 stop:529 length:300 start_codon:yes stop_codon:yes gene_type:complete